MAMAVQPPKRNPLTAVVLGALAVLLPAAAFATFKAVQMVPKSTGTTTENGLPSAIPNTNSGGTNTNGTISGDAPTATVAATGTGIVMAPSRTRVVVHQHPTDAVLFLDGERVTTTDGALMRQDHGVHKLRAERSGYVTREIQVTFDRDHTVDLVLDPKQRSGGGPTVPGTARTGTATTATTPTTPGGKDPETPDLGY
jgi:hypothetical protein